MSKGNTFENDLLLLIFNNTNAALIGDATGLRGASTAGSFYMSLHTSDPGEAGDQTTNECNYTSYARVAVTRSGAGFTVTNNSVALTAAVDFAQPGDTDDLPQTATHFAVGTASSGAGKILYKGTITPNIVISNTGSLPRIKTDANLITED
jgi:hypothetical protein